MKKVFKTKPDSNNLMNGIRMFKTIILMGHGFSNQPHLRDNAGKSKPKIGLPATSFQVYSPTTGPGRDTPNSILGEDASTPSLMLGPRATTPNSTCPRPVPRLDPGASTPSPMLGSGATTPNSTLGADVSTPGPTTRPECVHAKLYVERGRVHA